MAKSKDEGIHVAVGGTLFAVGVGGVVATTIAEAAAAKPNWSVGWYWLVFTPSVAVALAGLYMILGVYMPLPLPRTRTEKESRRIRYAVSALSQATIEGLELRRAIWDYESNVPASDVDGWLNATETLLREWLGEPYVARFRNDAGIPLSAICIDDPNRATTQERAALSTIVDHRIVRLTEFIQELS